MHQEAFSEEFPEHSHSDQGHLGQAAWSSALAAIPGHGVQPALSSALQVSALQLW